MLRELIAHAKKVKRNQQPVAPIKGLKALKELVGKEIGVTEYVKITQDRVNAFADATGT